MTKARDELRCAVLWIEALTDGMLMPQNRRARLALGCLDIAIEHQAAISVLAERPLWGPAYALLRGLLDALVRGVWLARCATDEDLDSFELAGLRRKSFEDMVGDVERALGHSRGALSKLRKSSWAMFSDFRHTSFEQVGRRHGPISTEPNYPAAETDQALRLAAALGLLAATELADLSGHRGAALACRERALKFAGARHE
ncbi:MAG: DUF6988 family protein [Steroidobacteraceae bacterium]